MAKFLVYDKQGNKYESYPLSKLRKLSKSKNPDIRFTAKTVLGWVKRGGEIMKKLEAEEKAKRIAPRELTFAERLNKALSQLTQI